MLANRVAILLVTCASLVSLGGFCSEVNSTGYPEFEKPEKTACEKMISTVLVYTNKNYHVFEKLPYHAKSFDNLHEGSLVCLKILSVSLNRKQNEKQSFLRILYLTRTINKR